MATEAPSSVVVAVSSGDVVSIKDLHKKAAQNRKKTSCTYFHEGEHKFLPLWGTGPSKLGMYGVGVTLYFQLLKFMAIGFVLLALVAFPVSYCFASGNGVVNESNKVFNFMASISIANVGYCSATECKTEADRRHRCLLQGCTSSGVTEIFGLRHNVKLTEAAEWIGLCDGVAICLFMLFSIWFQFRWIPYKVRRNDEKHTTCADFTLHVSRLPRKLKGDHSKYEEKLRTHFQNVLNRIDAAVDADAIQEVVCIRNYGGAINKFMQKGKFVRQLEDAQERERRAKERSESNKAEASRIKADKLEKQISRIDKHLKAQADLSDEQREVCAAFITFKKDVYKREVLREYHLSSSRLLRLCMRERLRFMGCRIRVQQACEPSDLYWENLDFSPKQRAVRQVIVAVLTILVMLICTSLLVSVQTLSNMSNPIVPTEGTWIIKAAAGQDVDCLKLCDWQLYNNMQCDETNDGTSRKWPISRTFTSSGDLASKSFLRGGCTEFIESGACSRTSPVENRTLDWIGVEFAYPAKIECLEVSQPPDATSHQTNRSRRFEVFACRSEVVPLSSSSFHGWRPEDHCVTMEDISPAEVTKKYTTSVPSGPMKVRLDTNCEHDVSAEVALERKAASKEPAQDATLICFCKQQVKKFGIQFRAPPYEKEEQRICEEWIEAENTKMGKLCAGVVVVSLLNQILVVIYQYLIKWERPLAVTDMAQSQMLKLFVSQFVNTGLLTLLVHASLSDAPDWMDVLQVLRIGQGSYDDISALWFVSVGTSLMITIAVQVFTTTVPPLVISFIVNPMLIRLYSRGAVTEGILHDIYVHPEWNLSLRLAQTMSVIFCVMLYSAGMPALYVVGIVYCFVAYWLDKLCLLRGSRRPPGYNEKIIKSAMHLMPIAALLHTIFALWTYGKQDIFPSDWSMVTKHFEEALEITRGRYAEIIDIAQTGTQAQRKANFGDYMLARGLDFSRKGNWLLLLIFAVFVVYYTFHYMLVLVIKPLLRPAMMLLHECCDWCYKGCFSEGAKKNGTSLEKAKEIIQKSGLLTSYSLAESDRYKDAYIALQYKGTKPQPSTEESQVVPAAAAAPAPVVTIPPGFSFTTAAAAAPTEPAAAATQAATLIAEDAAAAPAEAAAAATQEPTPAAEPFSRPTSQAAQATSSAPSEPAQEEEHQI